MPVWLTVSMVRAIHLQAIAAAGGAIGIRDETLLESALAVPRNRYQYAGQSPTIPELAAACGFAIIRNHPFVDGNKRAGIIAVAVFLALNGYDFEPDEAEGVTIVMGVAGGDIPEFAFAHWVSEAAIFRT